MLLVFWDLQHFIITCYYYCRSYFCTDIQIEINIEQCSNFRLCVAASMFCKTVGGVAMVIVTTQLIGLLHSVWNQKLSISKGIFLVKSYSVLCARAALNNAQIPDCVWPPACFVKQWEAWPWWQPQDNSRPPWPLVSTRTLPRVSFHALQEWLP